MQWTVEAEAALLSFLKEQVGEEDVIRIVEACLTLYKKKSRRGKRFAEILTDADFNDMVELFSSQD